MATNFPKIFFSKLEFQKRSFFRRKPCWWLIENYFSNRLSLELFEKSPHGIRWRLFSLSILPEINKPGDFLTLVYLYLKQVFRIEIDLIILWKMENYFNCICKISNENIMENCWFTLNFSLRKNSFLFGKFDFK